MKRTKLPPQSEEEIDKIRRQFHDENWFFFKKRDRKQETMIKRKLYGDDEWEEVMDILDY